MEIIINEPTALVKIQILIDNIKNNTEERTEESRNIETDISMNSQQISMAIKEEPSVLTKLISTIPKNILPLTVAFIDDDK